MRFLSGKPYDGRLVGVSNTVLTTGADGVTITFAHCVAIDEEGEPLFILANTAGFPPFPLTYASPEDIDKRMAEGPSPLLWTWFPRGAPVGAMPPGAIPRKCRQCGAVEGDGSQGCLETFPPQHRYT